jgi:hypothetical protein
MGGEGGGGSLARGSAVPVFMGGGGCSLARGSAVGGAPMSIVVISVIALVPVTLSQHFLVPRLFPKRSLM